MNAFISPYSTGLGKAKKPLPPVDPATDVLARAGYGPTAARVVTPPSSGGFLANLPPWALPVAIVGGVALLGGICFLVMRKRG